MEQLGPRKVAAPFSVSMHAAARLASLGRLASAFSFVFALTLIEFLRVRIGTGVGGVSFRAPSVRVPRLVFLINNTSKSS